MLGAVQEDSEENGMRLAGINLHRPRHRFALEQSVRSFALLNKRHASQDPQLKEATLSLLASLSQHKHRLELFCKQSYAELNAKEQRGVEILQLQYLDQILSVKTCFFNGPIPEYLTPEYVALLSAHESLMAKFPERSTITLDNGIIPGLYIVASKCPDYRVRLRAIRALQSWPHCEGFINSNIIASLALESLKRELVKVNKAELSLIVGDNEEELVRFLFDTLSCTEQAAYWSIIRASKILQHKP
ncbi:hypothetical protein APSETT444_009006 [Aspergillus pseudonomiae]